MAKMVMIAIILILVAAASVVMYCALVIASREDEWAERKIKEKNGQNKSF